MGTTRSTVHVQRASPDDLDDAIGVAARALKWEPDRPNEAFFRWKHLDNPFGVSPMWLAEVDGEIAGFRTFLRWRFRRPDGSSAQAVRAVDTATLPEFQGRGVFRALTLQAIDELRAEGVDFVFNTPNDQSRPGYLKMGWQQVGRVPVRARFTSLGSLRRLSRARVAADKWSEQVAAGEPAAEVLSDTAAIAELLDSVPPSPGYATERTPEYLLWRYRFGPLAYRAIALGDDLARGLCLFRVRRRGDAIETTIDEVLVPGNAPKGINAVLKRVRQATPADFLLCANRTLPTGNGYVPLPRIGPILTWRSLEQGECPTLDQWSLTMGDVELF